MSKKTSETVGSLIAKLSKLNPKWRIQLWDGNNLYAEPFRLDVIPKEVDVDGTVLGELVTIELDQMFSEYWWVPTSLSEKEKMHWIKEISKADAPNGNTHAS